MKTFLTAGYNQRFINAEKDTEGGGGNGRRVLETKKAEMEEDGDDEVAETGGDDGTDEELVADEVKSEAIKTKATAQIKQCPKKYGSANTYVHKL